MVTKYKDYEVSSWVGGGLMTLFVNCNQSIRAKCDSGLGPLIMKYVWNCQFRRNSGEKRWKVMGKKCLNSKRI